MARTTQEIQQKIIDAVQADPVLSTRLTSTSSASIWRLWSNIVAAVISTAESIMESFQATIQTIVDNNRIGTGAWYVEMAKQFQWSDQVQYYLVVDPATGKIGYNIINADDRIITQASFTEVVDGNGARTVLIKVAAGMPGNLQPLNGEQYDDFENYMRQIKIAGVRMQIVNLAADMLELDCNVYYDPAYNNDLLVDAIKIALDRYTTGVKYGGVIYKNAVIDAIQSVPGVSDVYINSLVGIQGANRTEITRAYTTYAGYFNLKKTDRFPKITLIAEQ